MTQENRDAQAGHMEPGMECTNPDLHEDSNMSLTISVIIPVFNSAAITPELVSRLELVLRSLCRMFEVILVDDGSRDDSWAVITSLCERRPWLRGVRLLRNYGQHNATLAGIRMARYGVIITMDDDLQQPPEEIPLLVARLLQGNDVVYGVPLQDAHAWPRALAAQVAKKLLQRLVGVRAAPHITSFRAFHSMVREAFHDFSGPVVSIDVLLSWGCERYSAVSVAHLPRAAGGSNYSLRMLVRYWLTMIIGFSAAPLRIASTVGLLASLFGFGVLVFVLLRFVLGGVTVPGFTFLASVISLLAGAQLLALGILGEYIAGMHSRSMRRPSYVVAAKSAPQDSRTDREDKQ